MDDTVTVLHLPSGGLACCACLSGMRWDRLRYSKDRGAFWIDYFCATEACEHRDKIVQVPIVETTLKVVGMIERKPRHWEKKGGGDPTL